MNNPDIETRLSNLVEASAALLRSSSLSETLAEVLKASERVLAADAYAIWGFAPGRDRMTVLLSQGLPPDYLATSEVPVSDSQRISLPELAVSRVEAEPVLARFASRYSEIGVRSMLVLPLKAAGEELGTLTFYYKQEREFHEGDLQIGRALANLSAAAISSAHLTEARTAARAELEQALIDQRAAETGLRLIAAAGAILNESLDYRSTLGNLTRAVVPALADWCAIHVVEDGDVQQVAVGHADPEKMRWAMELQTKYPPDPSSPQGPYQVIRTGVSEMMEVIPESLLEAAARDEEHMRIIRQVGLSSYICVPLRTRTEVIGAMTLIYAESGRTYDGDFLQVAEEFGRRAGLAVEKARLFQESERGRAELQRSNQAKDEFLGIVSHELRTPITTILGSARLLSKPGINLRDEDRQELLEGISSESQRMAGLIENLLVLARLEVANDIELNSLDIAQLVHDVAKSAVKDREVRIEGPDALIAYAEPTYAQQVVSNLLTNAAKYAPADQPIDVALQTSPDRVRVRVMDRGPGVDSAELSVIFDSFYRSKRTAHLPGKGLGLSICKRLVEAMGGEIWAAPRSGGGLEVGFTLPMTAEATATE